MQRFDDLEELTCHMFDTLDSYDTVSVVVNEDIAINLMRTMLVFDEFIKVGLIDIDPYDYDKEYFVSLTYDGEEKCYEMFVEKAYLYEKEAYLSTDGFVLFHKDVDRKALSDMCGNEYGDIQGYEWFTLGEEDSEENDCCEDDCCVKSTAAKKESNTSDRESATCKKDDHGFTVHKNGSDGEITFSVKYDADDDDLMKTFDEIEKRITRITDAFGEMDRFRRLFNW